MATVVKLADLDKQQVANIIQLLTLQPIDAGAEEQKKWGRKKKYTTPVAPMLLYQVTEDQQHVRLPYRFACMMFNKMMNQDRPHLKVIKDAGTPQAHPPFQAKIYEHQLGPAMEAYDQLFTYGTTMIGLPPGFGKTMIGVWLWYLTGLAGAIFVHRDTIAKQWMISLVKAVPDLAAAVWKIKPQDENWRQWFYTYMKSVPEFANSIWLVGEHGPPSPGVIPAIIICMDGRIDHVPDYIKKAIGTTLFDEFHLLCTRDRTPQPATNGKPAKTGCLLSLEPRYVIGETATLERDDGMHSMAQAVVGTHGVFRVSTQPYQVYCIETGIFCEETKTSWGTSFDGICKGLAGCQVRNLMIVDIVLSNPHRKFIILTRLADHVTLLEQYMNYYGVVCGTLYRNKSTYSDSRVLIGTVPKMGTGFDEENVCDDFKGVKADVLILAHSVKKWQLFEQVRGRVMRSIAPIVIWLNDKNQMIRRHFRGLEGWIQSTNGTVINMAYSQGCVRLPALPAAVEKAIDEENMRAQEAIKTKAVELNKAFSKSDILPLPSETSSKSDTLPLPPETSSKSDTYLQDVPILPKPPQDAPKKSRLLVVRT